MIHSVMSRQHGMDPKIFACVRNTLTNLYPDEPSIRRITADSGIDSSRFVLNSTPSNNWHSVLTEANKSNQVDSLLDVVENEYGRNKEFQKICHMYRQSTGSVRGPNVPLGVTIPDQEISHYESEVRALYGDQNNDQSHKKAFTFQIKIELESLVFRHGDWELGKSIIVLWVYGFPFDNKALKWQVMREVTELV